MDSCIGAFEAKAQLSRLLRAVENGEQFTITVRGKPVAELTPSSEVGGENRNVKFVKAMRDFMKRPDRPSLTAEQIKGMIEFGRR
jgi:prevent-host-death family protein